MSRWTILPDDACFFCPHTGPVVELVRQLATGGVGICAACAEAIHAELEEHALAKKPPASHDELRERASAADYIERGGGPKEGA